MWWHNSKETKEFDEFGNTRGTGRGYKQSSITCEKDRCSLRFDISGDEQASVCALVSYHKVWPVSVASQRPLSRGCDFSGPGNKWFTADLSMICTIIVWQLISSIDRKVDSSFSDYDRVSKEWIQTGYCTFNYYKMYTIHWKMLDIYIYIEKKIRFILYLHRYLSGSPLVSKEMSRIYATNQVLRVGSNWRKHFFMASLPKGSETSVDNPYLL